MTRDSHTPDAGYQPRRRPRWALIGLIVAGHVALGMALAHLLAPDFTSGLVRSAQSQLTVIVSTYEEEPPPPEPEPDAGAAGDPGRDAVAKPVAAPSNPLPSPSPVPRAASTGNESRSGAREEGDGTGNRGPGDGTGSGNGGQGRGGGIAVGPSVRSGRIDSARDFPIPPGGRQTRFGKSIFITFTVGVDGVASNCSVAQSQVDPEATALLCPLVIERIRFNPATDANGNPVPARYGYRQDFFLRN